MAWQWTANKALPEPMSDPVHWHIDGLVQDCSNSSALAVGLLQYCTKPSIYVLCGSNDLISNNIYAIHIDV